MDVTLDLPFAIGEKLWWVGPSSRREWVECPECAGTQVITMIQGNGTRVTLDCGACSRGYEPATGRIERTIFEHRPTSFTPQRVDIRGREIQYSQSSPDESAYRTVEAKDLFRDEDMCAARCAELNDECAAWEAKREGEHLKSKRRELAWSVQYWSGKVASLERDLAAAKARLNVAKAKEAKKS